MIRWRELESKKSVSRWIVPVILFASFAVFTGWLSVRPPSAYSATTSLVAAYSFDEGSGNAVSDSSGNGNTGALSGVSWNATGKYGKALTFSGSSSFVTVQDSPSLDLTTGMTLEAWIFPTATATNWKTAIMKETSGNYVYSLYAASPSNLPSTYVFNSASTKFGISSPSAIPSNTWSHVAATFDGVNLMLYVNGSAVTSKAATGSLMTSAGVLRIGGNSIWGEYFKGSMDEIRIYNRALSAAEIQNDMLTPIGSAPPPPPPPDTTPPTAPSALGASVISSTQINLSWTASTDNVGVTGYQLERCANSGCAGFAQIATPATTTYNDTGLAASVSYSYRVRAVDAAGNLSGYSNVATAMTSATPPPPDTTPPTAPSALGASVISSTQINLNWTGSTDNVGVTGYRLERCATSGCAGFAQIATPGTTTFSDTGLTASTSYSYRVRAADAAGNLSDYSNVATATTSAPPPPPPPPTTITYIQGNYAVPQTPQTTVGVVYASAQTAGDANVVVVGYSSTTATVTSISDTLGNAYTRAVGPTVQAGAHTQSIYYATNIAAAAANGNTVSVTFSASVAYPDIRILQYRGIDPVQPVDVTAAAQGTGTNSNSGSVTTTNANDMIFGANIVTSVTSGPGANFTRRLLTSPDGDIAEDRMVTTVGSYNATAPLTTGSWIMQLVAFRVASGGGVPPDTTPPTAPAGLTATPASATQINLGWSASADNIGVTGYRIERCTGSPCNFAQIGTSTVLSFGDSGLAPSTGYSYRVRAADAAGNLSTYSNVASATTPAAPPDTTPPAVSISAPLDGASVSGTVTISPSASDNVGVVGVQFKVDNANLGAEITASPFQVGWDTTGVANGSHALTATARDAANNTTTSAVVNVNVNNVVGGTPAQIGQWGPVMNWPLVAIHSSLLYTGKVLMWDFDSSGQGAQVWDPATNTFTAVPFAAADLFCAGHTQMADGRILVVGGHISVYHGITSATIFDPATQTWSSTAPMATARWYPNATALPDGRVLTLSGAINCQGCNANTPEIYDPVANRWSQLSNATLALPLYPHAFVLGDGRILVTGSYEQGIPTRALDLPSQTWSVVDATPYDGGSAVQYLPGKFLKVGLGTAGLEDISSTLSSSTAYVLDMNQSLPAWRAIAPMANRRDYHTLTVLPDGRVFVVGGGTTIGATDLANAVLTPEMWNPTTEAWTSLAPQAKPRLYHSTTVLLPDARVLVAGGGRNAGDPQPATDQLSAEIYSPPYLFKGPRPVITSAPTLIQYGGSFAVQTPDAGRIASAVLIRLGSTTHAFNEAHAFVPLAFTAGEGSVNVVAPPSPNLAPPGYYMLFLVDTNGVPSVAPILRLPVPGADSQPPTAPGGLVGTSSTAGIISLNWTAATDNVGVTKYTIYRSTAPGVAPSAGNRLGDTTALNYTDIAFTSSGIYYYVVTASDVVGNVGPASNEASVTASADTTPPNVSISAPTSGSVVTGVNTVTASASDDVAVVGVQLLLDGSPLGTEIKQPPYSMSWDTSAVPNGSHTLSARARDAGGNQPVSASVTVSVSNPAPVGLIAAYSFNEGSGSTVNDSSGHGNNGDISNASFAPGKFGTALSFTGSSSWVTVADSASLDLTTGMTIEAWIRPTSAPNKYESAIIKERPNAFSYALYAMSPDNQAGGFFDTTGGTSQQVTNPAPLPVNVWTHVAITYDGSSFKFYVNGSVVAAESASGSMITSTGALRFGGNSIWGEYFAGLLDEVRIYNRALTAGQIQTDMNTPLP